MDLANGDALLTIGGLWAAIKQWWHENSQLASSAEYEPVVDVGSFLTILAFSVAVFALAGPRYQLRQSIAFIPIKRLFFWSLVVAGCFTIFAEAATLYKWRIPTCISLNTVSLLVAVWIALLAIYWMQICFINPPRYSKLTAHRFFGESFRSIGNGTQEEMLALARELMPNFDRIIRNYPRAKGEWQVKEESEEKPTQLEVLSYQMLNLLADLRFCELIARELPSFPAVLVERLVVQKRFDTIASTLITRMVIALVSNKSSALFVENEWLAQGYIGETKPITHSIMFNWQKFERYGNSISSPLDLGYPYAEKWDLDTWQVYFGMAREYLDGLKETKEPLSSRRGVRETLQTMEVAYRRLGQRDESQSVYDPYSSTRIAGEANDFLFTLVSLADERQERIHFDRQDEYRFGNDLTSKIAHMYEESLFEIAKFESDTVFTIWHVQHNTFWHALDDLRVNKSVTMRMVRKKLRRMIWNEIKRMEAFANFKGAYYIRFCLFVLGFYKAKTKRAGSFNKDSWILSKVVTLWVIRNYQDIAISNPPVAQAMLPVGFKYDAPNGVLVSERGNSLTGEVSSLSIQLDPPKNKI